MDFEIVVKVPPLAILTVDELGPHFAWWPGIFDCFGGNLPDRLRADLVAMLRLHADKLESKEMDAQMAAVMGGENDA